MGTATQLGTYTVKVVGDTLARILTIWRQAPAGNGYLQNLVCFKRRTLAEAWAGHKIAFYLYIFVATLVAKRNTGTGLLL